MWLSPNLREERKNQPAFGMNYPNPQKPDTTGYFSFIIFRNWKLNPLIICFIKLLSDID